MSREAAWVEATMSTVSAAGNSLSTYISLALHTRVRTSQGLSGSTTAASALSSSPTAASSGQDAAFAAFAQAILAILPTASSSDSTSTGTSTAGTPATPAAGTIPPASADSVNGVAQALAAALGDSGQGSGGPAALLKELKTAVDYATAALVKSGVSASDAAAYAKSFRTQLSQAIDGIAASLSNPASAGTSGTTDASSSTGTTSGSDSSGITPISLPTPSTPSAADVTGSAGAASASGTYRIVEKGTIQFQLKDGSAVTIRLKNTSAGTLGSTPSASGAAAYAANGTYSSSRFNVSVQGSLSAEDLTAINNVLGQVDTLANQFFSGNLADAFASGAALNVDPTEIAKVSIRLSETENLRLNVPASTDASSGGTSGTSSTGSTGSTDSSGSTASAGGDSGTPPVVTTPVANTAPNDTTDTSGADGSSAASTPTSSTPATTSTGSGTTSSPGSLGDTALQAIYAYLEQVIATLGNNTQSGSVTISAKAKLDLLAGAVVGASLTVKESSAAGFLASITQATTDSSTGAPTA